ncbi:hypothetical protein [Amycolatopsis orientalis]|uniref:hypothetical protein n=1 Tax=Amycolatopsis orientalis TaxID=31958 RepID=UPI00131A0329|nr:hypothetical protein [Amycolatopsis orientalis]
MRGFVLRDNGFGGFRGGRRRFVDRIFAATFGDALLLFLRSAVLDAHVGEPLPCGIGQLPGEPVEHLAARSYPQGGTAGDNFRPGQGRVWMTPETSVPGRPHEVEAAGLPRLSNG